MPSPVPRLTFKCAICGKRYERRAKEIKPGKPSRYCSMQCRGLGMRNRVALKCAECGKRFERQVSERRKNKRSDAFCSQSCDKAQRQRDAKSYKKRSRVHEHRVVAESMPTREQVGILVGYKRSSRDAYLARLATKRLVVAGDFRGAVKASDTLFE
jgi:endogenous inhibitor of DNA gyrase (YacG/DUF329 family)